MLKQRKEIMPFNWLLTAKMTVGIFIFLMLLTQCANVIDPDLGWHLRIGHQILETKNIPHFDNLSFTMPNHRWIDHEWLVNTLFALAENAGIWWLIVLIFTFISFLPFLFWLIKIDEIAKTIPILVASLAWKEFIAVRPQVISLFFFFIVFQIIYTLYRNNRSLFSLPYRIILPLIFFIWANLHAGFFSGIILISAYIVAQLFNSSFIKKQPYKNLKKDLFCLGICILVTPLNPYGIALYQEIFDASTSRLTLNYIQEWAPLYNFLNFKFILFFSVFMITLAIYRKKFSPAILIISLVFLVIGVKSVRMFPFFIITAAPIVLLGFGFFMEELRKNDKFFDKNQQMLRFSVYIVLVLFIYIWMFGFFESDKNIKYPIKAAEFLKIYAHNRNDIRIFNDYAWGGYLSYAVPEVKSFIDGRMPHWKEGNDSAMQDYTDVMYGKDWPKIFARRDINLVLIGNNSNIIEKKTFFQKVKSLLFDETATQTTHLQDDLKNNGWDVIYEDRLAVIMEK
jgi:hypothetical protein